MSLESCRQSSNGLRALGPAKSRGQASCRCPIPDRPSPHPAMNTTEIVQRLWNLCHVLRDDGITYQDYVTELTFLLFLKMMQETGREDKIQKAYRWAAIAKREGLDQLDHYRRALLDLGKAREATVAAIFTDAQTKLRKPANLKTLT